MTTARSFLCIALLLLDGMPATAAQSSQGATVPWTTYEAETMTLGGGTRLGPPPVATDRNTVVNNSVEGESSGRQCVRLSATGQYVQFIAQTEANTLVVRYCVPDTANGSGADYTLSLYLNGTFSQKIPVTSKYSWLYGSYPFSNTPGDGSPRDFYDEVRLKGLTINSNDIVRLQVDTGDTATDYIIDLVDLETTALPLIQPPGSRSVLDYGAVGNGIQDDTVAISNCVAAGGNVWVPSGTYLISGDINFPAGTTLQGAGMWHTSFVGDPAKYVTEQGRIRFNGTGGNIHFADFAILGKLNTRNDSERNDGFSESFGLNSSLSRIWVEHTKTGAWIANSKGLVIDSCRIRNTLADGINLCVGVNSAIITNCTTRNTGDDGFAIWPATYVTAAYEPGSNVITHCTAQLPFLANGSAIYGGRDNRIEVSRFSDIPYGAGILIAGTFPVGAYIFRGHTTVQRCDVIRGGGYDFGWRGALTLRPHYLNLDGITIDTLHLTDSLSSAVQIESPGSGLVTNSVMSNVTVSGYGLGVPPYHPPLPAPSNSVDGIYGVLARNDAKGSLAVSHMVVNGSPITSLPESGSDLANQSGGQFAFNFLASTTITVTVQPYPMGHTFTVDGTAYSNVEYFVWSNGWSHMIGAITPQGGGAGTQFVWTSWSDGSEASHTIMPLTDTTYTANFKTQYYLTTKSDAGGDASPASDWNDSGTTVTVTATAMDRCVFSGWTGLGAGSYSGSLNPAVVVMNGPVTETSSFSLIPSQLQILEVTVISNTSISLTYSAASGFPYHVEMTSNLTPSTWTSLTASVTNATERVVSFTTTNAIGPRPRYYRITSP